MSQLFPRLGPLGDAAVTLTYGERPDPLLHHLISDHAARIARAALPGLLDIVPGYVALTIHFDPHRTAASTFRDGITLALAGPSATREPEHTRLVIVPVTYDGPDLEDVAVRTGLDRAEVVRRHCAPEYRVALLGFVPGFAYLGPLDPALVLPRRARPRTRVPAGSVAIAGDQTGIYPAATPGGWHLLGRTAMAMFDPTRHPPAALSVGDRVRFEETR